MAITFYDWPYSPFCIKVRALLDYKALAYRSINPLGHARDLARRGKTGKVPAIEIDGDLIVDSTDIAYAIDHRFPDPPLLPADPQKRALAHALEDWADESLYFFGLYYRWYEAEGRKPVATVFGRSLKGRLAYRFYLRRILGQLRGQGILRKPASHVARDLARQLEAVDALVSEEPYLLGSEPFLCDFALWGQLAYLQRTPVGKQAIGRHSAITAYLARMPTASGRAAQSSENSRSVTS